MTAKLKDNGIVSPWLGWAGNEVVFAPSPIDGRYCVECAGPLV